MMKIYVKGEHVGLWALMGVFIVIIFLMYGVAYNNGDLFGEGWSFFCSTAC